MADLSSDAGLPKTAPFDVRRSREAVPTRFRSEDSLPCSVGAEEGARRDTRTEHCGGTKQRFGAYQTMPVGASGGVSRIGSRTNCDVG